MSRKPKGVNVPTRLYTSFMMPREDIVLEEKPSFWVDVVEDYDTVFEKVFPATAPSSNLEARQLCMYTKVSGGRFSTRVDSICGFEEID